MKTGSNNMINNKKNLMAVLYGGITCCTLGLLSAPAFSTPLPGKAPGVANGVKNNNETLLSNSVLSAKFIVNGADLTLSQLVDKTTGETSTITFNELFSLSLGNGTTLVDTDMTIGQVTLNRVSAQPNSIKVAERFNGWTLNVPFTYQSSGKTLQVTWSATLRDESNYIIQNLSYTASQGSWDVDKISLVDLNASGAVKKGATDGSPTFSGQYFFAQQSPIAKTVMQNNNVDYYFEREEETKQGETFKQSAVLGIYPENQQRRGFQYYLERERAKEHKPYLHYNSWWDIPHGYITEESMLHRIGEFSRELITERNVNFQGYLLDDGYDYLDTNNASHIWQMNPHQFPNGLTPLAAAAAEHDTNLAIWMSPGGGYSGVAERITIAKKTKPNLVTKVVNDQEVFKVSDPEYYSAFKSAIFNKQDNGVKAFKFDRIFGSEDTYAVATLAEEMRIKDPDVFINATVGTWGSPYFMWFFDSIWRGQGDGLDKPRADNISYRDLVSYNLLKANPMLPLNSLMVHGIGQGQHFQGRSFSQDRDGNMLDLNDEDVITQWKAEVRNYFSMGFNLQELYITPLPGYMNEVMWDALAEAANWGHANHELLSDSHFIGDTPAVIGSEIVGTNVYGVASWSQQKAIMMLRNPKTEPASITISPEVAFELPNDAENSFILKDAYEENVGTVNFTGNTTFHLAPLEVIVYEATPQGGTTPENNAFHWAFNEASGARTYDDKVGIGATLSNGASWDNGKQASGISFDGVDDYIEIDQMPTEHTGDWTVSAWVKRTGDQPSASLLSSHQAALKLEQVGNGTSIGLTEFGIKDHYFSHSTPLNEWQHLTFVGTDNETKLYINGEFKEALAVGITLPLTNIGRNINGTDALKATVDDLKVEYKALSANEVNQQYGVSDINTNTYYSIVARHSDKALDVSGGSTDEGANIIQYVNAGGDNQQFIFISTENGYYNIVNRKSGLYLDIAGGSTSDGGNIIQWAETGGANQEFKAIALGGGWYRFEVKSSGKVISIADGSTANVANIEQRSWNNSTDQQFKLEVH